MMWFSLPKVPGAEKSRLARKISAAAKKFLPTATTPPLLPHFPSGLKGVYD